MEKLSSKQRIEASERPPCQRRHQGLISAVIPWQSLRCAEKRAATKFFFDLRLRSNLEMIQIWSYKYPEAKVNGMIRVSLKRRQADILWLF